MTVKSPPVVRVDADVSARGDARLRALTEYAFEIITVQDAAGISTYVNEAVKRHLGHAVADMVGRDGADFIHPDDRAAMRDRFRGVLSTKDAHPEDSCFEYRFRHRDG